MSVMDMSTSKLKRFYIRNLKKSWRFEEFRMTGANREFGLSAVYWEAHEKAMSAHEELKRRGVTIP